MKQETLIKNLPLGAAMLICFGVIKESIYYNHFGIDIMSYVTTSEVLTLFLNDYDSFIAIALITLVHLVGSYDTVKLMDKTLGESFFENHLQKGKWWFFLFFSSMLIICVLLISFSIISLTLINIYLLVFLGVQTLYFLFLNKTGEELISFENLLLTLTTLVIATSVPLLAIKNTQEIERGETKQIVLHFKDDFNPNLKNQLFIGKASEYYFFYNSTTRKTTAIHANDVRWFEVKNQ